MMKSRNSLALAAIFLMSVPLSLQPAAAEELSAEKQAAVAMVEMAVEQLDADGAASLSEAVNTKDPRYLDGELYLFVLGQGGEIVAHPISPELVGTDPSTLMDAKGEPFMHKLVEAAHATPEGSWVDYHWTSPAGVVGMKSSWIIMHSDVILGAGVIVPE